MTEQNQTEATSTDQTPDMATRDAETPDQTPEQTRSDDSSKVVREAAKYRRRAQEAEAERDQLRDRLTAAHMSIAESMTGLRKPSALWATGTTVDDLLDDDGDLDPAKVQEAAQAVVDELGIATAPKPDRSQGGGEWDAPDPKEQFTAAFGPKQQ